MTSQITVNVISFNSVTCVLSLNSTSCYYNAAISLQLTQQKWLNLQEKLYGRHWWCHQYPWRHNNNVKRHIAQYNVYKISWKYVENAQFYTQSNFVKLIPTHSEEKIAINFAITVWLGTIQVFNNKKNFLGSIALIIFLSSINHMIFKLVRLKLHLQLLPDSDLISPVADLSTCQPQQPHSSGMSIYAFLSQWLVGRQWKFY